MKTSTTIGKIAPALLKAQKLMGGATKGAANPYFKSRYADLGSVLEACKDLLNENGVTILQPHTLNERGKYVETLLLHESGEWVSGETEIVCAKESDPQAQGSAITYARRYGLQSLLSIPAEDDDGEAAMNRKPAQAKQAPTTAKAAAQVATPAAVTPSVENTTEAPAKRTGGFKPTTPAKAVETPKANGTTDNGW